MRFEGNVIICDPCSIVKSEEDWFKVLTTEEEEIPLNMEVVGIENYMAIDGREENRIIFIDEYGNKLGEACTDSSFYIVVYLEDILRYNCEFDSYKKWRDTCMLFEGFNGTIDVDKDDNGAIKNIVGRGNINFTSEFC